MLFYCKMDEVSQKNIRNRKKKNYNKYYTHPKSTVNNINSEGAINNGAFRTMIYLIMNLKFQINRISSKLVIQNCTIKLQIFV